MKLEKARTAVKSRRAISPVIATVILVAVAITVSVAVAYWMGGIAGQYTKFEKVEIQNAQCTKDATGWTVTLKLKNSGTATSTLIGVFVNEVEVDAYNASTYQTDSATTSMATTATIASGQTSTIQIFIDDNYPPTAPLTSGTTMNVKIHSAGGMDYIKLIELV